MILPDQSNYKQLWEHDDTNWDEDLKMKTSYANISMKVNLVDNSWQSKLIGSVIWLIYQPAEQRLSTTSAAIYTS